MMDPHKLQQAIEKRASKMETVKPEGWDRIRPDRVRWKDKDYRLFGKTTQKPPVKESAGCGSSSKLKESAGCKKASLDLSAQRGAALAKAAMADPDFREAAQMMSKEGSFWKNVAVGTAGLALAPVAYGVGQMGVGAVQKAYQSLTEGKQKAQAYSEMMKVHKKQLGSEDKSKIQTAFNSLWGLNPDMAKDPLVSGTYVTKAIDYGGVTTQEAAQLIQARKGMGEARAREDWMPDPKAIGAATGAFRDAHSMVGPES